MKRHLSVFELAARGAVYKTLIVSLWTAAVIFVLLWALPAGAQNLTDLLSGSYFSAEAENYVVTGGRYASYVFAAGLAALYVLLSRSGAPKRGVNPDYTWRRLRITERRASLIQSGVHALCFALYMAIVLAAFLAFAAIFLPRSGPYDNDGQTLFFAAFTTAPLHAVLPLTEPLEWLAFAATCLGGGVGTTAMAFWLRRGKTSALGVCLGIAIVLTQFQWAYGTGIRNILVFVVPVLTVGGLVSSFKSVSAADYNAESAEGTDIRMTEGGGADASA